MTTELDLQVAIVMLRTWLRCWVVFIPTEDVFFRTKCLKENKAFLHGSPPTTTSSVGHIRSSKQCKAQENEPIRGRKCMWLSVYSLPTRHFAHRKQVMYDAIRFPVNSVFYYLTTLFLTLDANCSLQWQDDSKRVVKDVRGSGSRLNTDAVPEYECRGRVGTMKTTKNLIQNSRSLVRRRLPLQCFIRLTDQPSLFLQVKNMNAFFFFYVCTVHF
jgi:hypothetical protein